MRNKLQSAPLCLSEVNKRQVTACGRGRVVSVTMGTVYWPITERKWKCSGRNPQGPERRDKARPIETGNALPPHPALPLAPALCAGEAGDVR